LIEKYWLNFIYLSFAKKITYGLLSVCTKYIIGCVLKHTRSCTCSSRVLIWWKDRVVTFINYVIYSWTLLSFCVDWQDRLLDKWTLKSRSIIFGNHFFCWFFCDRMSVLINLLSSTSLINLLSSTQKLIISNLASSRSSSLIIKVILIFVFNQWGFVKTSRFRYT